MAKAKSREIPEFGTWLCLTCDPCVDSLSLEQFKEHLQTVHGMKSPFRGQKQMQGHFDCHGYYVSKYRWTIGDVKAGQETVGPRSH